jgi:hypothetical protein
MTTPHIDALRTQLMATLADLRCKTHPMEPARALAVARVAAVLVDTARVEVDFLKATGRDQSNFLGTTPAGKTVTTHGLPNGINSVTRHRLEG